jgi:acetyltransferase-like isoleucine patch superfamily enzyme
MNIQDQLPHDWYPHPVPNNVEIGSGSWLYSSFAFLHYRSQRACGVHIGHHSGIYNGTFFDLGVNGEVVIGDYCTLVGAVIATNSRVTIGDYAFIAHEVTVADHYSAAPPDAMNYADCRVREAELSIGEGAWIGTRAILVPGACIGAGAIVGAGCVVNIEVPPFAIVAGNPARIVCPSASRLMP